MRWTGRAGVEGRVAVALPRTRAMPQAAMPPMPDDFASQHDVIKDAEHASREDVPYEEWTPPAEERSSTLEGWQTLDGIHRLCQTHRQM